MMLFDGETRPPVIVVPEPTPTVAPTPRSTHPAPVVERQSGKASYYYGSRSFHGVAHVAMQDGRWTGRVQRYVLVTINGLTKRLPVVDWCQCHRNTSSEKLIDLSIEAVRLFGLDPSRGVWKVIVEETR